MSRLNGYLEELKAKKTEVESQDLDAYVMAKLKEIEPQIRAEAEQSQAYELRVLDIKIEAITDAVKIVTEEQAACVEEIATESEETPTGI